MNKKTISKPNTIRQELIKEIDAFCKETGLKASTVCRKAAGDNLLYDRLKKGGDCTTEKVDQIRAWMWAYYQEFARIRVNLKKLLSKDQ